MKLTDNNALNVLIVVNVFALLAYFYFTLGFCGKMVWLYLKIRVVVNNSASESLQGNIQKKHKQRSE